MYKDFDAGKYRLAQLHREAEEVRLLALLKKYPQKTKQDFTLITQVMNPLKIFK